MANISFKLNEISGQTIQILCFAYFVSTLYSCIYFELQQLSLSTTRLKTETEKRDYIVLPSDPNNRLISVVPHHAVPFISTP